MAEGAEQIEVRIPARAEYVVVARLVAAGIAGRMGFSYDEIEDLKIAVAEACTDAIVSGDEGPIDIAFAVGADELGVAVAYSAPGAEPPEERELGLFLIRCLMDDVTTTEADRRRTMRMVKRLGARTGESEVPE